MTTTHTLETAEVDIAYDLHGPLPTADGRPPLVMIAQPMDASGFAALASNFPDRTVVTYDPRGLGRSTRKDGRVENVPTVQAEDDGSRADPLLSDRSLAFTSYRPDVDALAAAPTRIVIAVGEESLGMFTGRTAVATAELLGQQATVFPSHHGGFMGGESGYPAHPKAFARRLREVLDAETFPRADDQLAGPPRPSCAAG